MEVNATHEQGKRAFFECVLNMYAREVPQLCGNDDCDLVECIGSIKNFHKNIGVHRFHTQEIVNSIYIIIIIINERPTKIILIINGSVHMQSMQIKLN